MYFEVINFLNYSNLQIFYCINDPRLDVRVREIKQTLKWKIN